MTVDKEAIDMTAQEWFEKGSMFTLDFLLPEEQGTIYKIMDLYAQGKVRFHSKELIKKNDELNRRIIELQSADMTHEYNNAEAERVWPQIKQQIIDEATDEQNKKLEYWKQRCLAAEALMDSFTGRDISVDTDKETTWQQLKQQKP